VCDREVKIRLVISDAHEGLRTAIAKVLHEAISLVLDRWAVSLEWGPSRDRTMMLGGEFRTK
jgi:hypothetical protein